MINTIPPAPANAFKPIWINTNYTFISSVNSVNYSILNNGQTIFSGKAYKYPNVNNYSININRICENYLDNNITFLTNSSPTGMTNLINAAQQFTFKIDDLNIQETYRFYWNYNMNEVIYTGNLSSPINGHYASGMFRFNNTINHQFLSVYWNKELNNWLSYTTSACGEYALYYLNRNGGWDAFLIEGKVKEVDTYNRSTFERKGSSINYWLRESDNYKNIIEHSYELNTTWLKDDESKRLAFHLLSSNKLYLHNLVDDIIIPVNIVDSSCEYKTFKNLNKLVSYTIKVKESNKQIIL